MKIRLRQAALLSTSAIAALAMVGFGGVALAADQTFQFDIPAESLGQALTDFSRESSQQIVFSEDATNGKNTTGLHGRYTAAQALDMLLAGTDLHFEINASGVLMIRQKKEQAASSDGTKELDVADTETVVVTGTRIRGATPTSPVTEITQLDMIQAGQYTLGDAVRSIPQNFSGGQNPGVLLGASSGNLSNQNSTGGSAIDLRGIGPDATLTLLNGHRLAYDSFTQAVDVSAIPVSAVDRVEIVEDGASALYGSDAVAGVANIILKHDYDGLDTQARVGGATDGGDFQQQYGVVGGRTWENGGFIATYNYERDTAVYADQRSYTSYLLSPYMLLPSQQSHTAVVSGHQDLSPSVSLSVDATYNDRNSGFAQTISAASTSKGTRGATSFTVTPSLSVQLPASWSFELDGLYGQDNSMYNGGTYSRSTGALITPSRYCYCNSIESTEADAEGPLFELPAGDVRLALGAGYRRNTFKQSYATSPSVTSGSRHSVYGFGEVSLPIVSDVMNIPLINQLTFNAAIRYEDYSDFGSIATPKVGALYAPTRDIDFKASWGESYKTPTLSQEYSSFSALLYPAYIFGGSGYSNTATAIYEFGGNTKLKAERATTWAVTADFHPRFLTGFQSEISYFEISYRDRVADPINNLGVAFTDPSYQQFITYHPSLSQQQQVIAASVGGLEDIYGYGYDPSAVYAILDDQYTNVTAQHIRGVDLSGSYPMDVLQGELTLTGNMTWLYSNQQDVPGSTPYALSGTIYNPPTFRSRLGASWNRSNITMSTYFNYTGGLTNTFITPSAHIGSMSTVDFVALYRVSSAGSLLHDINLALSVQNITDTNPPYLKNSSSFLVDYDSTNYSPLGRFISLSITKDW